MIRELIRETDALFFESIENEYDASPAHFLANVQWTICKYAPCLDKFIEWGPWGLNCLQKKGHFLAGAFVALEMLRRFDTMTEDDSHFHTWLSLITDEFCTEQGASMCDDVGNFYKRPTEEIFIPEAVFLQKSIRVFGEEMEWFDYGVFSIFELFFRLEEDGVTPERLVIN